MEQTNHWDAGLYDSKHGFVSEYGQQLIEWLQPKPGEFILDLGCGTGDLTAQIHAMGAHTLGIDASPAMLEAANSKYPHLSWACMPAEALELSHTVDAVFSNAVLHWIRDQTQVIQKVYHALRPGGRWVAELGGESNVKLMLAALEKAMSKYGYIMPKVEEYWFYPSAEQYASLLEKAGFKINQIVRYARPTALEGEEGMRNWFKMFAGYFLWEVVPAEKEFILNEVCHLLRETHYRHQHWVADYQRLRFAVFKP